MPRGKPYRACLSQPFAPRQPDGLWDSVGFHWASGYLMPAGPMRVFIATIGVCALMVGCGQDDGPATVDLTIGDSVPLTGELSDYGLGGRKAADLAGAAITTAISAAGIDDTVKVIHEDNRTDNQASVEAARRLAANGAHCIAGAWAPSDSVATAKAVSVPEHILQISPASTSSTLTAMKDDGYLSRVPPADNLQGPVLAGVVGDQLGGAAGKSVNIGARNDAYGQALSKAFADAWTGRGGTVKDKVLYDAGEPSYNSEADRIATGDPDAFVIVDFTDTFEKLGPALVRTGNWDARKTFVTDGLVSSGLLSEPGPDVVRGMRGIAPGTPQDVPGAHAFDRLYTRSAPKSVERRTFDAQNFDAVILCYLSAVAAGSVKGEDMRDELRAVSGPPGRKYTWDQLPDAIKALRAGEDIDYEGAAGPIDLDANGDPTDGVYDVVEFTNRDVKPIKQVDAARILAEDTRK
jgi:ABC-type branched-subunit amino acid transport system substrate-binding protein